MVFPKPGLEYRYRYKLPDSVQREKKQRIRDHTKIYDLLSDEDLFDIRGNGLAKLDEEEAALFDKEVELNRKGANNDKTATPENEGEPSSTVLTKKRASLMGELKNRQELKAVNEIKQEPLQGGGDSIIKLELQREVSPSKVKKNSKSSKKTSNRGKKRKVEDNKEQVTGIVDSTTARASVVQPRPIIKDDSSKENEEEGTNALTFRFSSDRLKEPLASVKSTEVVWKSWLNSNATIAAGPCAKKIAKKLALAGDEIDRNESTDRMNSGKVEIKLTSLNYVKATWPNASKKKTRKTKKGKKSSKSPPCTKSPLLLTAADTISGKIQKKPRGSYKKRTPTASPKEVAKPKNKTSIKRPRLPVWELTQTQILRRVRYAIDKHFAKMPGTRYRCPRMREEAHSRESNGNTGRQVWWCLVCHKEELDENGDVMIGCDSCEDWYHLRCVGVPDEKYPENMRWYCKRCMARQIRMGAFDGSKFPLYVDS